MENISQEEYNRQCLEDLEETMKDDLRSWKEAERDLEDAIAWKNKMALNYAESAVKYYHFKNK